MSSLLTDLSVKCELQAMDKLALRKQVRELEDENAELRELCEVLINCGRKYHTMSGSCPLFDASAENDDFCGAVKVARRLGIEVD